MFLRHSRTAAYEGLTGWQAFGGQAFGWQAFGWRTFGWQAFE